MIDGRTLFTDWTLQNGGMMKGGYGFLSPGAKAEIEYYAKRVNEAAAKAQEAAPSVNAVEAARRVHTLTNTSHGCRMEHDLVPEVAAVIQRAIDSAAPKVGDVERLQQRVSQLEAAVRWALGEGDSNFGDNVQPGAQRFWWRSELRKRSGLGTHLTALAPCADKWGA